MITLRRVFTLQFSDNFNKQPILVQFHILRHNQHSAYITFNLVGDMSLDKQKERKSNSFNRYYDPYVTGELCERRDWAVTYTEVFVLEENSNLD